MCPLFPPVCLGLSGLLLLSFALPDAFWGARSSSRHHIVTPSITARGLLNIAALAGGTVASYG